MTQIYQDTSQNVTNYLTELSLKHENWTTSEVLSQSYIFYTYKKLISFSKYEDAIILGLIYEILLSSSTLYFLINENLN